MSRGHGAVQRQMLAALAAHDRQSWATLTTLAGDGATRARVESVRRALYRLAEEGHVQLDHKWTGHWQLCARLMPDDGTAADEATRLRAEREERRGRWEAARVARAAEMASRCPVARLADRKPCRGAHDAVRVVERDGGEVVGCRYHAAVLVAYHGAKTDHPSVLYWDVQRLQYAERNRRRRAEERRAWQAYKRERRAAADRESAQGGSA